jgi:hypothetical protein
MHASLFFCFLQCIRPEMARAGSHPGRRRGPLSGVDLPPQAATVGGGNCRVGPGNFTLSRSQIPDVNLSIHPARAIA